MDDVKEVNPGQEIEFRVLTTKGEVVDLAKFEKFTVYAFKEDGSLYYTDEYKWNGASYVSPEKHMWPTDGSYVSFQAYHQASGELNVSKGVVKLENFMTDDDISEQVDFVSAVAKGNKSSGVISLDFQHRLAQIEVLGRNTNPGYKCYVAGLRIAHVKSKGSYNLSVDKWELDDDKGVYEIIYDKPFLLDDTATSLMRQEGDNAFFIPQDLEPWMLDADNEADGVYVALLVKITTATSNKEAPIYPLVDNNHNVIYPDYDWAALPLKGEWEAGNKYVYTWDIPKVGGYVYPGKIMLPEGDLALQIDNFLPGTHIMGEHIHFLEPYMFPFEEEKNEADFIGTWNVDRMTITVHDGDVVNELELPSFKAIKNIPVLPEELYKLTFETTDKCYLADDTECSVANLFLSLPELGDVEIKDWTQNKMTIYLCAEEKKELSEGNLFLEFNLFYSKEGTNSDVLEDWENDDTLLGDWMVSSLKRTIKPYNGTPTTEELNPDQVLANKDLERFYKLTFLSPYQWKFYNYFYEDSSGKPIIDSPKIYPMMNVNGHLALLMNYTDTIYGSFSWYNVDILPNESIKIYGSITDIDNTIDYIEAIYIKQEQSL